MTMNWNVMNDYPIMLNVGLCSNCSLFFFTIFLFSILQYLLLGGLAVFVLFQRE